MRTNNADYVASHGRNPKGFGMWMFDVTGTDGQGRYTSERYSITGKLAEAKKEACRRLKRDVGGVKTVTQITVLP